MGTATSSLIVPAGAELHGERDGDGGAYIAQQRSDQRQVAQQAGAAVALDDFVDGAAEVEIEDVEAEILADAGGVGHDGWVGAEELGGDGMLVGLEVQVALQGLVGLPGLERRR